MIWDVNFKLRINLRKVFSAFFKILKLEGWHSCWPEWQSISWIKFEVKRGGGRRNYLTYIQLPLLQKLNLKIATSSCCVNLNAITWILYHKSQHPMSLLHIFNLMKWIFIFTLPCSCHSLIPSPLLSQFLMFNVYVHTEYYHKGSFINDVQVFRELRVWVCVRGGGVKSKYFCGHYLWTTHEASTENRINLFLFLLLHSLYLQIKAIKKYANHATLLQGIASCHIPKKEET